MKRLPVLQLSDETHIFSSNAAARFLYDVDKKIADKVNYWLEWDSINLEPALYFFSSEKSNDSRLLHLLEQLEKTLEKDTFLVNVGFLEITSYP